MSRPTRVPCAGGVVLDDAGRILLVLRGHAPSAGSWSVPGGRCEPGETPSQACVRELAEETGLVVEVVRFVGRVERPAPDGSVHVIDDYLCRVRGGTLRAGDDAADVRWVGRTDLDALPLAPGVREALASWSVLPR